MASGKSIFASKTFWVNAVAGVATVSGLFGLDLGLDPETQLQLVGGIMAIANIILRLITKEPATISG